MRPQGANGALEHKYKSPCKDCENRQIGCHGSCAAYNEYREKEAAYRKEYRRRNTY